MVAELIQSHHKRISKGDQKNEKIIIPYSFNLHRNLPWLKASSYIHSSLIIKTKLATNIFLLYTKRFLISNSYPICSARWSSIARAFPGGRHSRFEFVQAGSDFGEDFVRVLGLRRLVACFAAVVVWSRC